MSQWIPRNLIFLPLGAGGSSLESSIGPIYFLFSGFGPKQRTPLAAKQIPIILNTPRKFATESQQSTCQQVCSSSLFPDCLFLVFGVHPSMSMFCFWTLYTVLFPFGQTSSWPQASPKRSRRPTRLGGPVRGGGAAELSAARLERRPRSACAGVHAAKARAFWVGLVNWLWVKTSGTMILVHFSGDWDVHWGCRILTHGQLTPLLVAIRESCLKGQSVIFRGK